eukprot:gene14764-23513_t
MPGKKEKKRNAARAYGSSTAGAQLVTTQPGIAQGGVGHDWAYNGLVSVAIVVSLGLATTLVVSTLLSSFDCGGRACPEASRESRWSRRDGSADFCDFAVVDAYQTDTKWSKEPFVIRSLHGLHGRVYAHKAELGASP